MCRMIKWQIDMETAGLHEKLAHTKNPRAQAGWISESKFFKQLLRDCFGVACMSALNIEEIQAMLSDFKWLWRPSVSSREGTTSMLHYPLFPQGVHKTLLKASCIVRDRTGSLVSFLFLFFFSPQEKHRIPEP